MIKNYVSWSEFYVWQKDINQYYAEYILGVKPPPTPEMIFGSIVHNSIATGADVEEALRKANFTADYIRVAKDLVRVPKPKHQELKLYVQGFTKPDLVVILDGINDNEIVEYKTTKNGWRTQEEVDTHDQITLYTGAVYHLTGKLLPTHLYRLDSGNGKSKLFLTTRTLEQIEAVKNDINAMYDDLVAKGLWERRQMSSTWFVDQAKSVCQKFLSQFTTAGSQTENLLSSTAKDLYSQSKH